MSSSLSLPLAPSLVICKSRGDSSKDHSHTCIPKRNNNKENPHSHSHAGILDLKLSKRKLLLYTAVGLCNPALARAEPESPNASTSNRMTYSRFFKYLEEGDVKKVDLFENGTVAIAEIYNWSLEKVQRVKVQLPPGLTGELLRKMEEKDVDVGAYPVESNWWPAALDFLANFAFPLIFFATLFFWTSSSSTNNPAGPNLPFGLGRYDIYQGP